MIFTGADLSLLGIRPLLTVLEVTYEETPLSRFVILMNNSFCRTGKVRIVLVSVKFVGECWIPKSLRGIFLTSYLYRILRHRQCF